MPGFFKDAFIKSGDRRFFYRWYRRGRSLGSAWYAYHTKILKHAGLGGKSHTMGKGHVQWNRKGRW